MKSPVNYEYDTAGIRPYPSLSPTSFLVAVAAAGAIRWAIALRSATDQEQRKTVTAARNKEAKAITSRIKIFNSG